MSIQLLFWVLMILSFIFGAWSNWPAAGQPPNFKPFGATLLTFILLALLGWQVFGAALHK